MYARRQSTGKILLLIYLATDTHRKDPFVWALFDLERAILAPEEENSKVCLSREVIFKTLSRVETANNVAKFFVRVGRSSDKLHPALRIKLKKISTSHMDEYLGLGGLILWHSFMKRITSGCCPVETLFIEFCAMNNIERCMLIVLYDLPSVYKAVRKPRIAVKSFYMGFWCCAAHQLVQLHHADS